MRLKRCTRVIIAAFLILSSSAYILDKPGLLAASLSLWVLIICRYALFFSRLKSVAASVQIVRTIDKSLVRQGMNCAVTNRVVMKIEEGVMATYGEMIPAGIFIEEGEIRTHPLSVGYHKEILTYRVIPVTHGNILFPGGSLIVQDPFFETDILLSRADFTGPVLSVQPAPFFEKTGKKSQFGGVETHKIRAQHGHSIRTYRKYLQDDDFKSIDWKLSAKHDTLYVREYTSLENYPPLIIIDLPDKDQEFDEDSFSELIQAVSTRIEKTLKEGISISLLIISGPNIISSLYDEYDLARYMTIIRERLHPSIRIHHQYRTRLRSEIRDDLKNLRNQDKEVSEENVTLHRSLLNNIYHHHLLDNRRNRFSSQISRIFSSIRTDEISFYSLCDGDISYIRELSRQSRYSRVRFRIRTPAGRDIIKMKPRCQTLRGEIIEGLL